MKKFFLLCLFIIGLGWAITNFPGLAATGTYDSIVLDFREEIGSEEIGKQLEILASQYKIAPRLNSEFSAADNVYIVQGDRNLLNTLKKSDFAKKTEYIEPNYIYSAFKLPSNAVAQVPDSTNTDGVTNVPNDPMYSQQWNLRSINVEGAWNQTKGSGVTVAVIDTGVSPVSDLKGTKIVSGYDFVNDKVEAYDDNGHGTHVAGTIAQSTNNGYGVAGIAYEATIMPLKVLSASGGGTISDIAEAIKFAADNGADVINMSLGGSGASELMQEAVDYAYNKGVVVIAAAGNSGENAASYPARYPHVIGVSALDASGNKAWYSNFGAGVDLSAPGGDTREGPAGGILQNTIGQELGKDSFEAFQGTSMASPHVAGVAAFIKAVGIKHPDEVLSVLQQSARAVKEDPLNHFGAGQLDASAAVQLATKGQFDFRDFFRWLHDNGYLNPRFWIDGGAIALFPKILMVLGSYLLAWFLKNYFPFRWNWAFSGGLVAGSSGLFFLRGLYIVDLPQWPLRVMGSSIPELGGAVQGTTMLNPLFASVLIPAVLIALFLGHSQWKWIAIGSAIGVASCLAVNAFVSPAVWGLGTGFTAQLFLMVNALLCIGLARLALKTEVRPV